VKLFRLAGDVGGDVGSAIDLPPGGVRLLDEPVIKLTRPNRLPADLSGVGIHQHIRNQYKQEDRPPRPSGDLLDMPFDVGDVLFCHCRTSLTGPVYQGAINASPT